MRTENPSSPAKVTRAVRAAEASSPDGAEPCLVDPVDVEPTAVGIRDLARGVSCVLAGVARSGRRVLITRHGEPYAAIVPIDVGGEASTLSTVVHRLENDLPDEDVRAARARSSPDVFLELRRLAEALARAASLAEP